MIKVKIFTNHRSKMDSGHWAVSTPPSVKQFTISRLCVDQKHIVAWRTIKPVKSMLPPMTANSSSITFGKVHAISRCMEAHIRIINPCINLPNLESSKSWAKTCRTVVRGLSKADVSFVGIHFLGRSNRLPCLSVIEANTGIPCSHHNISLIIASN